MKPAPARKRAAAAALLALAALASGCTYARVLAYVIGGNDDDKINVKAQYHGLENKTLAVLVAVDESTMFAYPDASADICRSLTVKLAQGLPGVKPIGPDQIIKFQRDNPYWNTTPYSELVRKLNVQRLLVVDLAHFSLRDPGDQYVWRGQITANVSVTEADAHDPSVFAYSSPDIHTIFPNDPAAASIGVTNADDQSIRMGLLDNFSMRVLQLFRDHPEIQH